MKNKFITKAGFVIVTAIFVASTPLIFAQNSEPCSPSACDCSCECCPPKDPCAKCAQLWPSCGPDWTITPGAGPCTADGCDFFITAEFIYWAVRQDHMGFATTFSSDATSLRLGQIIQPKWRMEPGFRVGLGWLTCIDGWDLYLNYTWLRPRTKRRIVEVTDNTIIAGAINLFPSESFQSFTPIPTDLQETAKWDIDFNVLDFEWGRNFFISQCLHLRPHFGLKGTWIDQKFSRTAIATQQSGSTIILTPLTRIETNKIDYWAIGPRAGLDSAWHFTRCFSVLGEVAATALWGQFSVKTIASQTDAILNQTTRLPNNVRTQWHGVKPVLEFLLGLRFEDWWCCDEYYTAFDIGWEVQWWGGQNQFIVGMNALETRWGDLAFQGLTLRARFQF